MYVRILTDGQLIILTGLILLERIIGQLQNKLCKDKDIRSIECKNDSLASSQIHALLPFGTPQGRLINLKRQLMRLSLKVMNSCVSRPNKKKIHPANISESICSMLGKIFLKVPM